MCHAVQVLQQLVNEAPAFEQILVCHAAQTQQVKEESAGHAVKRGIISLCVAAQPRALGWYEPMNNMGKQYIKSISQPQGRL